MFRDALLRFSPVQNGGGMSGSAPFPAVENRAARRGFAQPASANVPQMPLSASFPDATARYRPLASGDLVLNSINRWLPDASLAKGSGIAPKTNRFL